MLAAYRVDTERLEDGSRYSEVRSLSVWAQGDSEEEAIKEPEMVVWD